MQLTRALCELREYKECAEYWDNIKRKPNNDIVKTMTELQTVSALYKVGRKDEAIEIYTRYGDVASIRTVNGGKKGDELELVYDHNPNSPYLDDELQKWLLYYGKDDTDKRYEEYKPYTLDDEKLSLLVKVASKVVNNKKTKKKTLWFYALASIYDITETRQRPKTFWNVGDNIRKTHTLEILTMFCRYGLMQRRQNTAKYNQDYEYRLLADLKWLSQKIKREVMPDAYKKLNANTWREYDDDNCEAYQAEANTFYWNDALRRIYSVQSAHAGIKQAGTYVKYNWRTWLRTFS